MGRTTSGRGRRAHLLAVLEAHGLGAAGAAALGVELRDRMLRTKLEYGAFIDAETGELFGDVLSGTADEVEAGPLLRALRPDRRYANVHTHPEGAAFSPFDAAVLVAHAPALCAIAAVGWQGVWYVLSPAPGAVLPAALEIRASFDRERGALAPTYERRVQAGELTRREAQRAYTHDAWERLAPLLGLRYNQV